MAGSSQEANIMDVLNAMNIQRDQNIMGMQAGG